MEAIEVNECSMCYDTSQVSRKVYEYDIKCDCCNSKNGNHQEIVWYCKDCNPVPSLSFLVRMKPKENIKRAFGQKRVSKIEAKEISQILEIKVTTKRPMFPEMDTYIEVHNYYFNLDDTRSNAKEIKRLNKSEDDYDVLHELYPATLDEFHKIYPATPDDMFDSGKDLFKRTPK